jgi:hypothetical protein
MPAGRARRALAPVTFAALAVLLAAGAAQAAGLPAEGTRDPAGPGPAADAAEDGPVVRVLQETSPSNTTALDSLQRFGWAILDEDGAPVEHNDAIVEVRQDGQPVFATEPSSGHDYDGIDRFWLGLLEEGPYEVRVEVPGEGGDRTASFEGEVVDRDAPEAELDVDAPDTAPAGEPVDVAYRAIANGTVVEHAQVLVEVVDAEADRRILQTDTHGHDGRHEATVTFPEPGPYELRLTAYDPVDREPFETVTATHEVEVTEGTPPQAGAPSRTPLENTVETAQSDEPYEMHVAYDPYTSTSRWGKMRISATVVDPADRTLVEHVDVDATLTGPGGTVLFATEDAHAYDGVFELETARPAEGDYTLALEATSTRTDWSASHEATFSVHAPAVPESPVQFLDLEAPGTLGEGQPGQLAFAAADALGQAYEHSEVATTLLDPDGTVQFSGKLHTHTDGRFPFVLAPDAPGDWTLRGDPFPTTPSAVAQHEGPERGEDRSFDLSVQAAGGEPADPDAGDAEAPDAAPGAGLLALAGAVLAAVALATGRRRRR